MSERPRKRAKLACVTCNARRVKCDVTDRQPCTNCAAGEVQCETRESKRGKHIRKPRGEVEARRKTYAGISVCCSSNVEADVVTVHQIRRLSARNGMRTRLRHRTSWLLYRPTSTVQSTLMCRPLAAIISFLLRKSQWNYATTIQERELPSKMTQQSSLANPAHCVM